MTIDTTDFSHLQNQLSKFLVIQQKLINAQRRIDQELLRSDVIQEYIRSALYSSDLHNIFEKTVSSMIQAFDIDCGALFIYQHNNDNFFMVNSSGMLVESKIISSDWINRNSSIARDHAVLLTSETIKESPFEDLGLHHAVIALLYDRYDSTKGILLGGISVENQPFYDPITPDHVPAIKVFTQQAQICLDHIKNKKFIQQIIDKDPGLIYVTTANHKVVMINETAGKYLNVDRKETINRPKKCIYNSFPDPQYHAEIDKQVLTNRKEQTYEQKFTLNSSGEPCWLQTTKIPIINEGEPDCVLTISIDVTLHKKAIEELIKAQKSRELFLANMSHEIRTPLNAIIGFSSLLGRKGDLSPKQERFLDRIKTASHSLRSIIKDILDVSAIEAGNIVVTNEPFNLRKIVQSVDDSLGFKAKEKGIELKLKIDPAVNCIVLGDPVRVGQILTNVVGNAIKFTEAGSVHLNCNIESKSNKELIVKFTIIDTGIGIAESKLGIIFNIFSQVDPSSVRKYEGTGLGLAISKQLAEIMNGQISVKSKLGEGTQFDIRLPFLFPEGQCTNGEASDKKKKPGVEFQELKVLIAEDNEANLELITSMFEDWNIYYRTAINGEEVLDHMSSHFDVIFMDIQMPVMDGITATKIIRNKLNLTIPIVAVTANCIKGDQEKYLQSGMDYYLSKPIDLDEMEKILVDIARKRKTI